MFLLLLNTDTVVVPQGFRIIIHTIKRDVFLPPLISSVNKLLTPADSVLLGFIKTRTNIYMVKCTENG